MLVRSDLKDHGIGWALMQQLIAYAKADGLALLDGEVLTENTQMLAMCRELGFHVGPDSADFSLCHVKLPLGALRAYAFSGTRCFSIS